MLDLHAFFDSCHLATPLKKIYSFDKILLSGRKTFLVHRTTGPR
jgi:hypothetical protein